MRIHKCPWGYVFEANFIFPNKKAIHIEITSVMTSLHCHLVGNLNQSNVVNKLKARYNNIFHNWVFPQMCRSTLGFCLNNVYWIQWIHWIQWQFFLMMTWTHYLLFRRQRCNNRATKTQVTERILKLIHIHASVICQIPLIRWIHWSSLSFTEN